jgi:hypothetical protein
MNGANALPGLETSFSSAAPFSLEVNQALLKEDDDLLRQIFSQVFRHHHPKLANKVDVIFTLAQVRPPSALLSLTAMCLSYPKLAAPRFLCLLSNTRVSLSLRRPGR